MPFSAARAHDCTWHGDATVLDDFNRGWPLLREPWAGEPSPGNLTGLAERIAEDLFGTNTPELRRALRNLKARRSRHP